MLPEQVAVHITAAEATLKTEYQRIKTEAEAFRSFRKRVTDVAALPRFDGRTTIQQSRTLRPQSPQSSCERVCNAYRDTVLSMPHYTEEYDEWLFEHLAAEFGEELAMSLSESTQLTPTLKKGLTSVSQQATQQRVNLLAQLDAESAELDTAQTTLRDLRGRLADQTVEQLHGQAFDELQSLYVTFHAIYDCCDNLAKARQQSVRTHDWTNEKTTTEPALQPYLYADLDVTYPILADLAEFGLYLQQMQEQVEQTLAGAH